jgi:hypothetical protein
VRFRHGLQPAGRNRTSRKTQTGAVREINVASIPLIVLNQTNNTLIVTGFRGSDLSQVAIGTDIPPLGGRIVAYFNTPGNMEDNWDWVYLKDLGTQAKYQIYVEWNRIVNNNTYSFFGYFNADSSQQNGDPSPFPADCAMTSFISSSNSGSFPVYILTKTPTAQG